MQYTYKLPHPQASAIKKFPFNQETKKKGFTENASDPASLLTAISPLLRNLVDYTII